MMFDAPYGIVAGTALKWMNEGGSTMSRTHRAICLLLCCMAFTACGDDDSNSPGQDAGDSLDQLDTGDAPDTANDPDQAEVDIPGPPDCGDGVLVTREATNGDVAFRLDRCMAPVCGGGCPVTSPQLIVVTPGHTDVATSDVIAYTQTHHNWLDSLVATLPDRRIDWHVEFVFEDSLVERHTISIEALDGSPILDETVFEIESY
jgi:hypothetical protein